MVDTINLTVSGSSRPERATRHDGAVEREAREGLRADPMQLSTGQPKTGQCDLA
jgi:hypothetical protein